MRGRNKKIKWYSRATVERIARNTGISEQEVERVLQELPDPRAIIVRPERAITWRTVVKVCLWMVGLLFAFIFLVVLMLVIAGR